MVSVPNAARVAVMYALSYRAEANSTTCKTPWSPSDICTIRVINGGTMSLRRSNQI